MSNEVLRSNLIESTEDGVDTQQEIEIVRHAQKASGNVFAEGGTALSTSLISPRGKQDAVDFGKTLREAGNNPKSVGVTSSERTSETARAILAGANASDEIVRKWLSFTGTEGEKLSEQYSGVMNPIRDAILARDFEGKKLSELSPDEQQAVMEEAEEPAVEWWLDHRNEKVDPSDPKEQSPHDKAAIVSYKLLRFIELPPYLPKGKKIHLVAVTHKTATEPFLVYGLLLPGENHVPEGEEFQPSTRLKALGGSLRPIERWKLKITTDNNRQLTVKLVLRGNEYDVDLEKVHELAEYGKTLLGVKS